MDDSAFVAAYKRPVTSLLALSAIGVSVYIWTGGDLEHFTLDFRAFNGQPWRFVSPVLPHADLIHLAFNVYWLFRFGSKVEDVLGSRATFSIYVLLAFGSSLAEYALMDGGIGLSGIGYGLFGLLWVLTYRDPRFAGVVNQGVVVLFVVWFFLCIATTMAGVWQIGNVAHGAGAILGVMLGFAITGRTALARRVWASALTLIVIGTFAAALVARPWINFGQGLAHEMAYLGYEALLDDDNEKAICYFEQAVASRPKEAGWWFNLGIAYHRMKRMKDAEAAYGAAAKLDPGNAVFQDQVEAFNNAE
ncbi:MAG: rhomboid family intramembrane serine protease [Pirellulales bacterium]